MSKFKQAAGLTRIPEWRLAKDVLAEVLSHAFAGTRIRFGRVDRLGEGLSHDVFVTDVEVEPDEGRSGSFVVALPHPDTEPGLAERSQREAELLAALSRHELPFRIPSIIGLHPVPAGLAVVKRYLHGLAIDMRASKTLGGKPWELIGQVAAAIHRITLADLPLDLPSCASRRAHALAKLAECVALSDRSEVRDAFAWIQRHLPPETPSVLLHGDLLGQNILWHAQLLPAVIDWEQAQWGDPAYDLAIVTRGVRRPFQVEDGLDMLLEAYRNAGGMALSRADIYLYELCMQLQWYGAALTGEGPHPPDTILSQLRGVLRRAQGM